jgi:hypothetical protein
VAAPDLLQYTALALTSCCADFGKPEDASVPTVVLWGLTPECVFEPQERQYNLYLQQGSDGYQARLQIGHEIFHRVCSRGRIFHWTHEMLACMFSVRLLRQSGANDYADQTEREYAAQAVLCSFEQMLSADLCRPPYPPGLYGRAFVTGMDWQERYGWTALCRLPEFRDPARLPDLPAWLSGTITERNNDLMEHALLFLNQK